MKIATLGPEGTFCEIAVKQYIKETDANARVEFCPSINLIFNALEEDCDIGIIPIENSIDGFVQRALDVLVQSDYSINREIVIPVDFTFVSNAGSPEQVKKIYVQYVAEGQCTEFLNQFKSASIVNTESNSSSYLMVKRGLEGEAAVIPEHLFRSEDEFGFTSHHVMDCDNNKTRFFVISKSQEAYHPDKDYKTSLIIMEGTQDQPGILSEILHEFTRRNINLVSIVSRPTKKGLGKYYFIIDVEGHSSGDSFKEAYDEISKKNVVKTLGSYYESGK